MIDKDVLFWRMLCICSLILFVTTICFLMVIVITIDLIYGYDIYTKDVPCYDKESNVIQGVICKEKYQCSKIIKLFQREECFK